MDDSLTTKMFCRPARRVVGLERTTKNVAILTGTQSV
jgi:hypothetical protein